MNAFCILFAGTNDINIEVLTEKRTLASLPYGGRFRMIDFILSSLVKANVPNIGIITKNNYASLMDHLGWGKDWDLDRKHGGLKILTPHANAINYGSIKTKFEDLLSVEQYIDSCLQDYCILSPANIIANIDFRDLLNYHIETNADISVVYANKKIEKQETEMIFDEKNRCYDSLYHHNGSNSEEKANVILKIYVLHKKLLKSVIETGVTKGWEDLARDYISKNFNRLNVYAYKHEGAIYQITDIDNYFKANMDLLNKDIRDEIFKSGTNILTKIRDSVPTTYGKNANIKNSFIADGCFIDGHVENSIIFRDVHIAKGSVIKNSIIFQATKIGENVSMDYVISDKKVNISANKKLIGDKNAIYIIHKEKEI